MLTRENLFGIYVALLTPFDNEGQLDERRLRQQVRQMIAGGVRGLVPNGGTGEYAALSRAERRRVVEIVTSEAAGRVPVVAGIVSTGYADALEAARDAKAAGADGLMLITPFYVTGSQQGIATYFRRMRAELNCPLLLYEIPGRTNVAMQAETVQELAEDGTIVGMKYSSYNIPEFIRTVAKAGSHISIMSGEEPLLATHVAIGGRGGILTTANLFPQRWSEIFELANNGMLRAALEKQAELDGLLRAVFAETNPGPMKELMKIAGKTCGSVRLPLTSPTKSVVARLSEELSRLSLEPLAD